MNSTILLFIIILILGGVIGFLLLQEKSEIKPVKTELINYLPKINPKVIEIVNSNSNSNSDDLCDFSIEITRLLIEIYKKYMELDTVIWEDIYGKIHKESNSGILSEFELLQLHRLQMTYIFVSYFGKKIYDIDRYGIYNITELKPIINILDKIYEKLKTKYSMSYKKIKEDKEFYNLLKSTHYKIEENMESYIRYYLRDIDRFGIKENDVGHQVYSLFDVFYRFQLDEEMFKNYGETKFKDNLKNYIINNPLYYIFITDMLIGDCFTKNINTVRNILKIEQKVNEFNRIYGNYHLLSLFIANMVNIGIYGMDWDVVNYLIASGK